jgi:ribosomal protein S18
VGKLSHEEYVERVRLKHNGEIEVISEYMGAHHKIKLRHNVEGCYYEWETGARHIINSGSGCPVCNHRKSKEKQKYTHEEYVKKVKEKHNGEILVIDRYAGYHSKILHKHMSCGFEWLVSPAGILGGTSCPKCKKVAKLTQDEFVKRVYEIHHGEIEVLSDYVNNKTKILFRHITCGFEWMSTPQCIVNLRTGCPKCGGSMKLTHEEYVNRVNEIHNCEIEVLSKYVNMNERVKFRHNVCGNEWEAYASSVVYAKSGCPKCASSKGEALIRLLLKERGVVFLEQYKFDDCRNIRPLPFDFAVFQDKKLLFLIEWDGEFHFESKEHFGGEEAFQSTQLRDRIKNEYCMKNNIPLLRIPYWTPESDIVDMIDRMLNYRDIVGVAS